MDILKTPLIKINPKYMGNVCHKNVQGAYRVVQKKQLNIQIKKTKKITH